jgi:hypothetical protein
MAVIGNGTAEVNPFMRGHCDLSDLSGLNSRAR